MKRIILISVIVLSAFVTAEAARAETAIGVVFGYPGNAGLSLRKDRMPIGVAWSSDFIHGTIDKWMIKKPLSDTEGRLSWYLGPGVDLGIPLDDAHDFFMAVRAPIGLQFMLSPKFELFGEVAAGFQFLDETDFYWASALGIRYVLGQKGSK